MVERKERDIPYYIHEGEAHTERMKVLEDGNGEYLLTPKQVQLLERKHMMAVSFCDGRLNFESDVVSSRDVGVLARAGSNTEVFATVATQSATSIV